MKFLVNCWLPASLIASGLAMAQADIAAAVSLSLTPSAEEVQLGDSFELDLVASDLGAFEAPSVSAFSLDIGFDSNILSFNNLAFGNALDLGFGLSFQSLDASTPGSVSLLEFSFAPPPVLEALQPSSITLATLTFDTVGVGTTRVNPEIGYLGDAIGDPLFPTSVRGSVATVQPATPLPGDPKPIPLPGEAWLPTTVLMGLWGFWLRRKRSKPKATLPRLQPSSDTAD